MRALMRNSLRLWGFWVLLLLSLLVNKGQAAAAPRKEKKTQAKKSAVENDLYFYDNAESLPVLEYKGHQEGSKGDFTKSKNPSIVNFYGVFCVSLLC